MTNKSFEELKSGYENNDLTLEELSQFLQLIQLDENAGKIKKSIEQLLFQPSIPAIADEKKGDAIFKSIMTAASHNNDLQHEQVLHLKQKTTSFTFSKMAVAASIIGLLVAGSYLWLNQGSKKQLAKTEIKKSDKNDLPPGRSKAVLTLANGSTIVLDDAQNGAIAQQGNTKIIKLNGKLDYNAAGSSGNEILYNIISTPRGGQYQVELPDGSQVWLNAESSLRFPAAFTSKERIVEIKGEAYFEIAKNKAKPFIVKVNDAEIQVLGTHFNVNAYNDESAVKTTLLEGSVKFVKNNNSDILAPGQQSQMLKSGQVKVLNDIDTDEVVAWKNGFFHFQGTDIGTVLRQLSRWYDADVAGDRNIDDLFYAEIPRNTNLSDVLKALELTGKVHFEIDGKRIKVKP